MANQEHLELLKQGTNVWNEWREQHPDTRPDLSDVTLLGVNLTVTELLEANPFGAFYLAAYLRGANLSDADLSEATLVRTNLTEATLTGCHIYGISAWDIELTGAIQKSLVITPPGEPTITTPCRVVCKVEARLRGGVERILQA